MGHFTDTNATVFKDSLCTETTSNWFLSGLCVCTGFAVSRVLQSSSHFFIQSYIIYKHRLPWKASLFRVHYTCTHARSCWIVHVPLVSYVCYANLYHFIAPVKVKAHLFHTYSIHCGIVPVGSSYSFCITESVILYFMYVCVCVFVCVCVCVRACMCACIHV